jgi:hypothetical protein
MSVPFAFSFDPTIATICVTLTGRWSTATVDAYRRAVLAILDATPTGLAPRKALFDLRACSLHSREVAEALSLFHHRHTPDMDKLAILTGSALAVAQAKRIGAARESRHFAAPAAARAWLA